MIQFSQMLEPSFDGMVFVKKNDESSVFVFQQGGKICVIVVSFLCNFVFTF